LHTTFRMHTTGYLKNPPRRASKCSKSISEYNF
jgi:hypothetical protein